MKSQVLKKIIKEAVQEVFREELKDILIEALKNNKTTINENVIPSTPKLNPQTIEEKRQLYGNILKETMQKPTSSDDGDMSIDTTLPIDTINGALPEGNVSLDQISKLIGK